MVCEVLFFSLDKSHQSRTIVASLSESVCRPLKTRIEQVIVSEQGKEALGGKKAVQLYKISSLLSFYQVTISQVSLYTSLTSECFD